uniref:Uncharacterized protein n=1 Tax=Rhizophora mucronata TaxID=61149 RepID=A0A2P2Q704_RHIMU
MNLMCAGLAFIVQTAFPIHLNFNF